MAIRKRTLPSGKIVWLCGYTDSAGKRSTDGQNDGR
jgi:hypothetical protein